MAGVSDVQRLMGRGVTIKILVDEEVADAELRFTARRLATIEDDYDGLENFTQALRRKPFRTVADVLRVTLGVSADQALDMVDSKRMDEYVQAISDALEAALPAPDRGNGQAAPGESAESASLGAASSTSQSSAGTSTPSGSGRT